MRSGRLSRELPRTLFRPDRAGTTFWQSHGSAWRRAGVIGSHDGTVAAGHGGRWRTRRCRRRVRPSSGPGRPGRWWPGCRRPGGSTGRTRPPLDFAGTSTRGLGDDRPRQAVGQSRVDGPGDRFVRRHLRVGRPIGTAGDAEHHGDQGAHDRRHRPGPQGPVVSPHRRFAMTEDTAAAHPCARGSGERGARRSRRLLLTTSNEDRAIASPAINGFRSPRAARGRAATL
jgi:hypothetical protein